MIAKKNQSLTLAAPQGRKNMSSLQWCNSVLITADPGAGIQSWQCWQSREAYVKIILHSASHSLCSCYGQDANLSRKTRLHLNVAVLVNRG